MMEGRAFDVFGAIYEKGRAASQAAEKAKWFDNCGPEGYCAVDIFET